MSIFKAGNYCFDTSRKTYVMGILNVTPDSFSDGGKYNSIDKALKRAFEMKKQGVDIIDIGGQSTRPGCTKISVDEELERVYGVVRRLTDEIDLPISVDTFYSEVASEVLRLGVSIINDVSGCGDDMLETVAKSGCGVIIVHSNGEKDIKKFFNKKIDEAESFGIDKKRLCFDPGIGFSKSYDENMDILKNFDKICIDGCAMMVAVSRKRCIGTPLGDSSFKERDIGTVAAHVVAICKGANIVRVHNINNAVQSVRVADAIIRRL